MRGYERQIDERLKNILVDELKFSIEKQQIQEGTSLYGKGLGLDSLDVVSLLVRLEDEFEIFFESDEVAASIETFGALLEVVRQKLNQEETQRC